MKNKLIKIFMLIYTLILLLCFSLGMVACKEYEKEGKIYSLEEAYELNYLTRQNVIDISNNYQYTSGDVTAKIISDIGQSEYEMIKVTAFNYISIGKEPFEKVDEISLSDADVLAYYGIYSGCVVLKVGIKDLVYTEEVKTIQIDGVEINYSGPKILVWVN